MSPDQIPLVLDGQQVQVPAGSTLRETVAGHIGRELDVAGAPVDGGRLGVAVAVDGTVIPRADWHDHVLTDGVVVDVVTATQGG